MAQAPSLWGDALSGFTGAISNPLTLGGLSLLSGGDLNQGIAAGTALQRQQQQQRQQQALQQGIMGMPNLNENDRQILGNSPDLANSVLGEIYKNRFDPMAGLDKQYKQAQIQKLTAEAADAGSAFGKAGTVVQGPNDASGNPTFYTVQFGSRGQRQILPLQIGGAAGGGSEAPVSLAPAKGVDVQGDLMYNKATGQDVRNIAPNLQGGEFAKKTGALTAEGANNLPKAQIALAQSKIDAGNLNDNINTAIKQSNGFTTGLWGTITSNIPNTPAHDLANTLTTIKSNLGFDKLADMRANSPTGGALGNVSDREGELLQSTWQSVAQSQSKEQLVYNLRKIQAIKKQYQALKQQAYDIDVARFGRANVPDPVTGQLPGQSQAPTASAPAGQQSAAPSQEAAAYLKANPGLASAFDQKYGPGASAKILGGQ